MFYGVYCVGGIYEKDANIPLSSRIDDVFCDTGVDSPLLIFAGFLIINQERVKTKIIFKARKVFLFGFEDEFSCMAITAAPF